MTAARWLSVSALAVGSLLAGCKPANKFVPPPPPEVDAAKPTEDYVAEYLQFTGTTRAEKQVEVRARVTGYLKEIKFEDGATVEKGDLLFVIEPRPFENALDEARASLQRAEAAEAIAQSKAKRREALIQQGSTLSREEYDVALADLAMAKADVALAKTSIVSAEVNLRYSQITAPISGRIGRHLVDEGNLVEAETTALATIESVNPVFAYFDVSDSDVVRLLELQPAETATVEPTPLTLATDRVNFRYEGTLDWTDVGINPDTRTQLRRGVFQDTDGRLLSGMFVRLRVAVSAPMPKVLVEERAIASDQRGDYLLVLEGAGDAPDTMKVQYRPVTLGIAHGKHRVVESGLALNDIVVVNGLQRARPGGSVKLSEASRTALGDAIPEAPAAAPDAAPEPAPAGPKGPVASAAAIDAEKTSPVAAPAPGGPPAPASPAAPAAPPAVETSASGPAKTGG